MKKVIIISLLCFVLLIVGCSVPPEPSDVGFDLDIEISKITIYKDSNYLYSTDYQALTFDSLEDIEDIKEELSEMTYYNAKLDVNHKKEIYDYIIKLRDDYVIYIIDNEEFIMYYDGEYKEGMLCKGTFSVFNMYNFGDKLEVLDKNIKFEDITYMSITYKANESSVSGLKDIKVNVTSNNYIKNLFVESVFYVNNKALTKDLHLYDICVNNTIYSIYNNGLVLEEDQTDQVPREYYVNLEALNPIWDLITGEKLSFEVNEVTKIEVTNKDNKTKEITDKEDFVSKIGNVKYYQVKNPKDFVIGDIVYKVNVDGVVIGIYKNDIIIVGDTVCTVTEGNFDFLKSIDFGGSSGWLPWV